MPVPVSVTGWRRNRRCGQLGAQRRMASTFRRDVQPALAVHGIAAVDGEIHQRGFELRDIGDRETVEIGNVDVDPDPGADQRTDQLRHRLDLGADIEHLRLQGLPAGERQQLSGQLGGALHRRNRVDMPAPLFRSSRRRGSRSRIDMFSNCCSPAPRRRHCPTFFHLLRRAHRFLALAALGDVDASAPRRSRRADWQRGASQIEKRSPSGRYSRISVWISSPRITAMKASRTVSRMPSVPENHGVSQNGWPITSLASAQIPASAVLLAYRTSPCRLSRL